MKLPQTRPSSVENPKICITAAAVLIKDDKALLIKHKKLKMWLSPGGHVDPNETLHQAAEREFWEETGVEVEAIHSGISTKGKSSDFVPSPISANVHWISESNFFDRTQDKKPDDDYKKKWGRDCEQHVVYVFLVKSKTKDIKYKQNVEETDGIAWFTLDEIKKTPEVNPDFLIELENAFQVAKELGL